MQKRLKIILTFFFVSVLITDCAIAQQVETKKDSIDIYKNIESYSERNKFTKFIYQLLFRPSSSVANTNEPNKPKQVSYGAFEGKIIRNIKIETLDPFGNSIDDTTSATQNFIAKSGNTIHLKSRRRTIQNLLLFKRNQQFDSLLVKESERLVRSQDYVSDVLIFAKATSDNSDSVDIFIRELDIWSLIPSGSTSLTRSTFNLSDKNFLGLGHEFQNEFTQNFTNGKNSFSTNYSITNIRNTYITTTLHYEINEDKYFNKSLSIDRPFYSPFAKWAAGVNITQKFRNDSIRIIDSQFEQVRFKYNAQDYWAGYAMQIFKGNTENKRTTNFISALRFSRIRYLEKPIEKLSSQHLLTDENFYMASIGISTRKYIKDEFIFKYDITEDVPIGRVFSLTAGYQEKHATGRIYLGALISFGNYHSWGYLSANFEYGTFFLGSKAEQSVFNASVIYFTKLMEIGNWKFRQFAKPELTIGINQFESDRITINDESGLNGFNSSSLVGTRRFLLTLQTQSYSPWNFFGFRFGPYFIYSLGMLGDETTKFKNSKMYSQLGLGVLIRNENLIFNTFQFSIAFYPIIPGNGKNVFKLNSFKTTDFGFRDFEIGKPEIVIFR